MSAPPISPRVLRGAIVGIDALDPVASVIAFQFNPDRMTRTLRPQTADGARSDRSEAMRLTGPPEETLDLQVEFTAVDGLERGDAVAESLGVYPQLSALEMLVYPKSALVIANSALLAAGTIEVIPPEAPFTVLVWGPRRVLPVRITSFTIAEEEYDASLNPIRATVNLGLRVLSTNDLTLDNPGYAMFLAHQVAKEAMAVVGSAGSLADVLGSNVRIV